MPIDIDSLANKYGSVETAIEPKKVQTSKINPINIDSLANKYGGGPSEAPKEMKEQEWWQGLSNDPTWGGLAKRIGVGVVRGAKDVIDTGAHGLQNAAVAIGNKVLPEETANNLRSSVESLQAQDKAGREKFAGEYGDSLGADIGRIGGQIAATAPLMPVKAFQAIEGAAGALPTVLATGEKIAAPLVNRLAASVGTGAAGGAIYGAATSGANDKSVAENVGEGAISGAIGGPLATAAGDVAKGLGKAFTGKISGRTADLAKRAEELGIPIKPTQISNSKILKKYDQMSGMLPFSGADKLNDKQASAFTKAVSRTFGENTDELTPELVEGARKKIGNEIGEIAKRNTITVDDQFRNDLQQIADNAGAIVDDSAKPAIAKQFKNIVLKIDDNGQMTGEAFQDLIAYKNALSQAQKIGSPGIRNVANELRSALDDVLERSISGDDLKALKAAKGQYKAVMTVKDLADKNPYGAISPLQLMSKVLSSPGGKLRSGELGELADIGRAFFPTPSDSGTPLGNAVLGVIKNPLAAGAASYGAAMSGVLPMQIAGAAATVGANRLARNVVQSNASRRAMIRAGTGETYGATNKLSSAVAPYTAPLIEQAEPLRITVQPQRK